MSETNFLSRKDTTGPVFRQLFFHIRKLRISGLFFFPLRRIPKAYMMFPAVKGGSREGPLSPTPGPFQKRRKHPAKKELKLALHFVKKYWWRYLLGIAALFLVDRINARVPLLSGELTDGLAA